jgi:hypothetical protein
MSTFQQQVQYIFDRPVSDEQWYDTPAAGPDPFEGEQPLLIFEFLEKLLQSPATVLSTYSDDQVAQGLDFIFNSSSSNYCHQFKLAPVDLARKLAVLQNLFLLFRDVLNPRCMGNLSAGAQRTWSQLNDFCYMFWDISPLSVWVDQDASKDLGFALMADMSEDDWAMLDLPPEIRDFLQMNKPAPDPNAPSREDLEAKMMDQYQNPSEDAEACYSAILEVMRQCLYLSNPACAESGLHGLGELAVFQPKKVAPIIAEFLLKKPHQDQKLLSYALAARDGMVL